jgi:hypothetical protein
MLFITTMEKIMNKLQQLFFTLMVVFFILPCSAMEKRLDGLSQKKIELNDRFKKLL